ncbi:oxidoreductase-like protein [Lophiostoma macrostomum CBS 122681]|uniref:Oxidoreductase-like protein n=1 Tax=Lophiostoma macrostomum CBS 122681 TaxID=1314788 RepID=A0A6A6TH60_9PLEO|nr:oxidoreductase-like protein [Lophiostoma macrostomum CBS 122681]
MSQKIPFAIIGTSWITHDYVKCAQATSKFSLRGVYSRTLDSAKDFASRYQSSTNDVALFDSLDKLAADPSISTVYIASPNSLHYTHAHAMLSAGKHVILEKPSTCTSAELTSLFTLAYAQNLILVEAWRHVHETNFLALKAALPNVGRLLGANVNFCQFSSRYDRVLAGETPNVFNLDFGAGALTDLGCYCVAFAVELFGSPVSAQYFPVRIATGADGGGTLLMHYEEEGRTFTVTIVFSKMFFSTAPCEVFGERGTLVVPTVTDIERVEFVDPRVRVGEQGRVTQLGGEKVPFEYNLREEAEVHGSMILERDVEAMRRWEGHSRSVLKVTEGVRRDNGLLFPVERK